MYCVCYRLETSTNWTTIYNGSDTEWIVSDDELNYHEAYVFKVAARNVIGWGPFSNDSLPFVYTPREYIAIMNVNLPSTTTVTALLHDIVEVYFLCN